MVKFMSRKYPNWPYVRWVHLFLRKYEEAENPTFLFEGLKGNAIFLENHLFLRALERAALFSSTSASASGAPKQNWERERERRSGKLGVSASASGAPKIKGERELWSHKVYVRYIRGLTIRFSSSSLCSQKVLNNHTGIRIAKTRCKKTKEKLRARAGAALGKIGSERECKRRSKN